MATMQANTSTPVRTASPYLRVKLMGHGNFSYAGQLAVGKVCQHKASTPRITAPGLTSHRYQATSSSAEKTKCNNVLFRFNERFFYIWLASISIIHGGEVRVDERTNECHTNRQQSQDDTYQSTFSLSSVRFPSLIILL